MLLLKHCNISIHTCFCHFLSRLGSDPTGAGDEQNK